VRAAAVAEVEGPQPPEPDRPAVRLRRAGREALAFARLATLMPRDVRAALPRAARPGDDVVVLLHGLLATAGVLRPLRRWIERHTGAHTASFSYVPGPGVDRLATRLGEVIALLPDGARVHLVGHSLGGIVARWYVQELDGGRQVVQTISLASPFDGAPRARLVPVGAGRDIAPGSGVLSRLAAGAARAPVVPHLSIAAADDSLAAERSCFAFGERHVIRDCGHNALLYHPDAWRLVVDRILGRAGSAPAKAP
jgi:pimeloyl-ACP methyl ester carboxylesterase